MRGKPRTRAMTAADVRLRAQHADDFLETATDSRALHPKRTNVAISNAVLAGIAATDAICGHLLGHAAKGDAHDEAIRLLDTAGPDATPWANDLRRLLALKTNSQYSPLVLTDTTTTDAIRWASRLTTAMHTTLTGP